MKEKRGLQNLAILYISRNKIVRLAHRCEQRKGAGRRGEARPLSVEILMFPFNNLYSNGLGFPHPMKMLGEQRLCDIEGFSSPASVGQATCKMMGFSL